MDSLTRFFPDGAAADRPAFLLLGPAHLRLAAMPVQEVLARYDNSLAVARCEIQEADAGATLGLVRWGNHTVRLLAFAHPLPVAVLETCLLSALVDDSVRSKARTHQTHIIADYFGDDPDPVRQYAALAAVAGALTEVGVSVVLNQAAHAAVAGEFLEPFAPNMVEMLGEMPPFGLYAGLVGSAGWWRTHNLPRLGLPDFALRATSASEFEGVFGLLGALVEWLRASGTRLAEGETLELGDDEIFRIYAADSEEDVLRSENELLVLERITRSELDS
jgi:Zn-dependent protease